MQKMEDTRERELIKILIKILGFMSSSNDIMNCIFFLQYCSKIYETYVITIRYSSRSYLDGF